MGVQERALQYFAAMADEVAACGGVAAYVLRPGVPGFAYAYIMTTAHGASCLCCKRQQPYETTTIISLQATEEATLTLPMPVCTDCCNIQQILAAIDCVCVDLFPHPVRLQIMQYGGGGKVMTHR